MTSNSYKIKSVIFDMDGVMFDTEKLAKRFWKEVAKKFNYRINDRIFKETIGLNVLKTKKIYKKHFGNKFPYEEMRNEKVKLEKNYILTEGVPVKEGLFELLDFFKEKKLKIALATSTGRERTEFLLNLSGAGKYFDVVICGDEIKNGKPEPDIFIEASQKLKCLPENCMVIEDSKNGVIAACRAGMLPVMVPDMIEPQQDIKKMLFKQFGNLKEVKSYFKNSAQADKLF